MSIVSASRPSGGPQGQPPRQPVVGLGSARGPSSSVMSVDPFRVLRRHFWLLLAAVIVGASLGAGSWFVLDRYVPRYTERVLFQVQPGLGAARDIGIADFAREDEVVRLGQTEINFLLSRPVIMDVVRSPEVVDGTRWIQQFQSDDGFTIHYDEAVDELLDELRAGLIRNSNLFQVTWSTRNAEDVPVVLNRLARAYIDRRRDLDRQAYDANRSVFTGQLDETTNEIDALTEQIEQFIIEHGITALDDPRYHHASEGMRGLVDEIRMVISGLSIAYTEFELVRRKLEGTIRPTEEDREMARRDHSVARLDMVIADAQAQLESQRSRFRDPMHPQIRGLEATIEARVRQRDEKIEEVIRDHLAARMKMTADTIERYERMLSDLQKEFDERDEGLRDLASHYADYRSLEDRRRMLEEVRNTDLTMLRELDLMRLRDDASRVRIWLHAQTPREKSFPRWQMFVPLGVVVMLGLVGGIVFLREMTDSRVRSERDLGMIAGARVLGVAPDIEEDPTRIKRAEMAIYDKPQSVLAESYRQICAPLMKSIAMAEHRSLLVLGGLPGAGTTTAVTNIASICAASGRRVIVVDANFRRPRLADLYGVSGDRGGLGDVLHDEIPLDDAIQTSADHGVDVLTAGTRGRRVFERLNTPRFDEVLASLRDRYDLVIIDSPPAVVAGEAMVLASKVDSAMLVVRANIEQRGLVARIIRQLSEMRSELIGVMLNRATGTTGGYFRKNFAVIAGYQKQSRK